ncbi:hypothetical protein Gorai_002344, partial [Gossypium raimondii]|nr:hypothetical protein [Gossypium raimondii]
MDVGRMESMSFKDKLVQDWGSSSASNNKVVEDDDIEIKDEGVITVQPWSYSFTTLTEFPSEVCVWIPLPRLPGVRTNGVVYGFGKTLISKLFIDGKLQRVEYERLPNVCFQCGCYGYAKDLCSLNVDRTIKEDKPTNPCPARKMDHSDIELPIKKDMEVNEEIMNHECWFLFGPKDEGGTVSLIESKWCENDADKGITNEPFLSFKATKMKTGLDSLKHTVVRVDENFNLNITVREESESRLVMQSNRKNDNTPSVRMMPPDPRDPKMDTGLTFGEGSEVSPRRKENGW